MSSFGDLCNLRVCLGVEQCQIFGRKFHEEGLQRCYRRYRYASASRKSRQQGTVIVESDINKAHFKIEKHLS